MRLPDIAYTCCLPVAYSLEAAWAVCMPGTPGLEAGTLGTSSWVWGPCGVLIPQLSQGQGVVLGTFTTQLYCGHCPGRHAEGDRTFFYTSSFQQCLQPKAPERVVKRILY